MNSRDKTDRAALSLAVQASVASDRVFRSLLRSARAAGLPPVAAIRCASRAAAAATGVDVLAELGLVATAPADLHFGARPTVAPLPHRKGAGMASSPEYGIPAFVEAWKGGHLPVPHTVCRTSELYRAYLLWCQGLDVDPINVRNFLRKIERAYQGAARAFVKVDGRNARLLITAGYRRKVCPNKFAESAASEATRFRAVLLEWRSQMEARATAHTGELG